MKRDSVERGRCEWRESSVAVERKDLEPSRREVNGNLDREM